MTGHILVVDDEALYRDLLSTRLTRNGYRVTDAEDGESALARAREVPIDLALVDIKMPGIDGIEVLQQLKAMDPLLEVVIVTGHGTVDSAIAAMKLGAFDYLAKPYKLSEVDVVIERALERRRMAQRCAGLSAEVSRRRGAEERFGIGESEAWTRTLALARKAAPLDLPVLITGESGAGKEVIANALHRWSDRAEDSFVPLNCGLLQDNLIESELFGHKRGAFTGATADRTGLFEIASNGTLFLDEIGEMPVACQAKLLRVLDSGEFRPLGTHSLRRTRARVVAATHRDLAQQVADEKFRHDLLFRLNVVHIPVPALRERREDIPLLVDHLLGHAAGRIGQPRRIGADALAALCEYHWPGNVRELRNVVERLAVLAEGEEIDPRVVRTVLGLPSARPAAAPPRPTELRPLAEVERDYIHWALEQVGGNVTTAAAGLGVSRSTIYRVLKG